MAGAPKAAEAKKVLLTPTQKTMWRESLREQAKGLDAEKKKSLNEQARLDLESLNDEALTKTREKYQAAWDALSPKRQEKLKAKMAEQRQKRQASKAAAG